MMASLADLLAGKIPPHSLEAERAVLGGMLLDRESLPKAVEILKPSDFYKEGHRKIFDSMLALFERHEPVDLLTVSEELRRRSELDEVGGPATLAALVDEAATLANVASYAATIGEHATRREMIQLGTELVGGAYKNGQPTGELIGIASRQVDALARRVVPPATAEPELRREGFDLTLVWPTGVSMELGAIRDSRDGVRGELTVRHWGRRLAWGSFALSSTAARETLRKKLEAVIPGRPWGNYLEQAAWQFTQAARQGEPLVTLTGAAISPTRELLRRLLYEGEPTLTFGDGDTGKSLFAISVAVAVQSGAGLPFGLKPVRPVSAAYLDWETSRDTAETRVALVAAGLGVDPPPIVYKRMTRPLVDEAAALAAEFARRGIGLVVVDSMMFAVAGGDGAAFHEPITAFYNALRLFAPAASLVISHVTGADARGGGPARPFGGAFAFNGPRLIWEAKRDQEVTDATAIAFTCRKANNLPQRPEPFGLRFQPAESTITIYPLDLAEASPSVVAGAGLSYRIRLALASKDLTTPEIAEALGSTDAAVRTTLHRLEAKQIVANRGLDDKATLWGLARP